VVCAGVCGTDRLLVRRPVRPGTTLGHEVVCADGGGRIYALNNEIPCGRCRYCREGLASHCLHLLELGVNRDGGFSRELRAPAASLHPIRVRDPRTGILVEPMACALHGAERLGGILAGSAVPPRILLLGAGVSGRLLAFALRQGLPAAELSVHDAWIQVPDWARPIGVHPLGRVPAARFHAVAECSGTGAGIRAAFRAVRRAGTVLLYGIPPAGLPLPASAGELFARELAVIVSRAGCDGPTFARALALVEAREEALAPILGRTVGLRGLPEELLRGRPLPGTRTLVDPTLP
jgi:threonine dehydrogenase-like Zn-dependent dehydrogenase